ncbi:MAG: ATP-binding protein [Campylobacterota bacterium]|nr:ATP-binding protein [Campylobacterota bacterium]
MKNIKIKSVFILLFIITYSFIFNVNFNNKNNEIDKELNKISQKLENSFGAVEDEVFIEVTSTSSIVNQDKIVIDTMRKAKYADKNNKNILRKKLQKHLDPLYQMIQSEGVMNFQFVLPSNKSFLRMHQPDYFDDDISLLRYTYKKVNIDKEFISGLEQGVYNVSYRYVFPLFDMEDLYLGAYEISYSIEYMQDLMQSIDGIETDFLTQDKEFKKDGWQDKYEEIKLNRKSGKLFTLYIKNDETTKVISFLPLTNAKEDKTLAYLISYTDSDYIHNIINRYINKNIIIFFILLVISVLLYRLTLYQKNIQEERERFQLAIDSSNEGIWDWDIQRNKIYFSPRYQEMLGISYNKKGIFEDTTFYDLKTKIHDEDKELFSKELEALLTNKQDIFEAEYRVKHENGDWIWILGRAKAQYDNNNKAIRVVGFYSDITQKKEFENSQERLIKELKEVADAKSNFLATMSHEIRTPMNAVLGFIQILQRKEDDAKKLKMLNTISDSGNSLLRIINDILDFSKIDNNKLEIENILYNITDSFSHVRELYHSKTQEKAIFLRLNVDDRLPKNTMGDKVRVEQVASNLVSNAIKFSEKNTIIEINVTYVQEKHLMRCEVKDQGIGIAKDKLEAVFHTFTQEDSSTTRKYGGTGLGLSISKELCRLMGGKIWVESEVGIGSSFIFTLPLPKDIKATEIIKPQIQELKPKIENKDFTKVSGKVLIVEDNLVNQELLFALLEEHDITYSLANDGLEAIGIVQNKEFNLILMDENMPNMCGIEATKIIKSMPKMKDIPIVAVTANAVDGDKDKFLDAGMDDYISKPIVLAELNNILNKYLVG